MEQMGTQEVGPREAERHRILKLIAEPERSARLVKGGSGPEPATEVLVHQPAVHQHVERIIGSADLDRVEQVTPESLDGGEPPVGRCHTAMAHDELQRMIPVAALTQQEDEAAAFSGAEVHLDLKRRTGIEAGAELTGKPRAAQCSGSRKGSIATEEEEPISRGGAETLTDAGERDSSGEFLVVGVSREDRAALRVELADDVKFLPRLWRAENPLVVAEHTKFAAAPAPVRETQHRELDRIVCVHEHAQVVHDPLGFFNNTKFQATIQELISRANVRISSPS